MALTRRRLPPSELVLPILFLLVSLWPLIEGSLGVVSFILIVPLAAVAGFGMGALLRAQAPGAWIFFAAVVIIPAGILGGLISPRASWAYAWGFLAGALLAARVFVAPDEGP